MKQKYWSVRSRLLGEVKVETPFISVSKSIDSTELSSGLNHITVFNIHISYYCITILYFKCNLHACIAARLWLTKQY